MTGLEISDLVLGNLPVDEIGLGLASTTWKPTTQAAWAEDLATKDDGESTGSSGSQRILTPEDNRTFLNYSHMEEKGIIKNESGQNRGQAHTLY